MSFFKPQSQYRLGIILAFGALLWNGTYNALAKGLTPFLSPVSLLILSEALTAAFIVVTFGIVPLLKELRKMGAQIKKFNPNVENPEKVYNFNLADDSPDFYHAIKITGPKQLHNAIVTMHDIRAGEAVVIAALAAKGRTTIFGVEKLDRGHEKFEERLNSLGAKITRVTHEISL